MLVARRAVTSAGDATVTAAVTGGRCCGPRGLRAGGEQSTTLQAENFMRGGRG